MNIRRIILGILALILFGGITTALYHYAGGIQGEPIEGQSLSMQTSANLPLAVDLAADGFVLLGLG